MTIYHVSIARMEIQALQLFLDVARRGSFAAVAREHNIDPSFISRQIAALEDDLGFRLFDRTTRRLALTEPGQLTFKRIQNPLEELNEIRQAAHDIVSKPSGTLRVTTSLAFAERWLVPRLALFKKAYPAISLDLVLSDTKIDLVSEGIDVGIRLGNRMEGSFVTSKLLSTRYQVVASPAYLENHESCAMPSDLKNHDCIVFPFPGYRSQWRFKADGDPQAREEIDVSGSLIISSALAIRRAALEGLGVALLGDWTICEDLANGKLVNLFPAYEVSAANFDTAAWILYPSRAYVPAKTRAFIDHLRATI